MRRADYRMLNASTFRSFVRSLDILLDISLKFELILSDIVPESGQARVGLPFLRCKLLS
jgi:hypothetical protein